MISKKCFIAVILICVSMLIGFVKANATQSISDAIRNGKINGEFKVWYQTNDNDADNNNIFDKENSIFDAGLGLGYTTDNYHGFSASVNFFAIDDLSAYDNFANNSIHGVDHSDTASWLGEAFISYNKANTNLNIGRQNLKSPLINSDNWAVFPNNFEAVLVQNHDLPNTTVSICYVSEERTLKSETFEDIAEDGGIFLGVVNKSLPNSLLSGYYYHIDDVSDIDAIYFEATAKMSSIKSGRAIYVF